MTSYDFFSKQIVEIKKPDQILLPVPVGNIKRCQRYNRFSTIIATIDQTYKIQVREMTFNAHLFQLKTVLF